MPAQAFDEPLALSAALARRWAAESCLVDATGHRCDYYHGLWQTLRLVGLAPTLGGHPHAYLQAMQDVAQRWCSDTASSPRRVLISGCADYAMLAHVLHAFAVHAVPVHVTVLDICPTPLRLNAWYAQRVGQPVELVCADLLQHTPHTAYDLVVTSSFLGFFSPARRPPLFAAYARMMRPDARLIFSNRLRPQPESEPVGFDADAVMRFATQVTEMAAALPGPDAPAPADVHRMALAYATQRLPYPVNSIETLRALAVSAGLQLERACAIRSDALQLVISGPTLGDGSDYVFVVMRQPGHALPSGTAAGPPG